MNSRVVRSITQTIDIWSRSRRCWFDTIFNYKLGLISCQLISRLHHILFQSFHGQSITITDYPLSSYVDRTSVISNHVTWLLTKKIIISTQLVSWLETQSFSDCRCTLVGHWSLVRMSIIVSSLIPLARFDKAVWSINIIGCSCHNRLQLDSSCWIASVFTQSM